MRGGRKVRKKGKGEWEIKVDGKGVNNEGREVSDDKE